MKCSMPGAAPAWYPWVYFPSSLGKITRPCLYFKKRLDWNIPTRARCWNYWYRTLFSAAQSTQEVNTTWMTQRESTYSSPLSLKDWFCCALRRMPNTVGSPVGADEKGATAHTTPIPASCGLYGHSASQKTKRMGFWPTIGRTYSSRTETNSYWTQMTSWCESAERRNRLSTAVKNVGESRPIM